MRTRRFFSGAARGALELAERDHVAVADQQRPAGPGPEGSGARKSTAHLLHPICQIS